MKKQGSNETKEKKMRSRAELAVTVWLTRENASFSFENHFLYLHMGEERTRVFLCRQFPFDLEWEFISVMNADSEELGIIRNVADFDDDAREMICNELRRKYYCSTVKKILSAKERYGFSYWKVLTEEGEITFTLHDTYRSIIRAGETRVIFLDVNGNRFEIPDVSVLDRKSQKKIELYL